MIITNNNIIAELRPSAGDTVLMFYDLSGNGVMGNLFFVNQSSIADKVRIAICPMDQAPNPENYLMYDGVIPPNHTVVLQEIALSQYERLYVFSQNGTTSFVYTGLKYSGYNPPTPPVPVPPAPYPYWFQTHSSDGASGSTVLDSNGNIWAATHDPVTNIVGLQSSSQLGMITKQLATDATGYMYDGVMGSPCMAIDPNDDGKILAWVSSDANNPIITVKAVRIDADDTVAWSNAYSMIPPGLVYLPSVTNPYRTVIGVHADQYDEIYLMVNVYPTVAAQVAAGYTIPSYTWMLYLNYNSGGAIIAQDGRQIAAPYGFQMRTSGEDGSTYHLYAMGDYVQYSGGTKTHLGAGIMQWSWSGAWIGASYIPDVSGRSISILGYTSDVGANNYMVGSNTATNGTDGQAFIMMADSNLNIQWIQEYRKPTGSSSMVFRKVALDSPTLVSKIAVHANITNVGIQGTNLYLMDPLGSYVSGYSFYENANDTPMSADGVVLTQSGDAIINMKLDSSVSQMSAKFKPYEDFSPTTYTIDGYDMSAETLTSTYISNSIPSWSTVSMPVNPTVSAIAVGISVNVSQTTPVFRNTEITQVPYPPI